MKYEIRPINGEMMDTGNYYTNNTYHILVRETNEDHVSEWFGYLTLSTQADGEIFVDLSFDDQPVEYSSVNSITG